MSKSSETPPKSELGLTTLPEFSTSLGSEMQEIDLPGTVSHLKSLSAKSKTASPGEAKLIDLERKFEQKISSIHKERTDTSSPKQEKSSPKREKKQFAWSEDSNIEESDIEEDNIEGDNIQRVQQLKKLLPSLMFCKTADLNRLIEFCYQNPWEQSELKSPTTKITDIPSVHAASSPKSSESHHAFSRASLVETKKTLKKPDELKFIDFHAPYSKDKNNDNALTSLYYHLKNNSLKVGGEDLTGSPEDVNKLKEAVKVLTTGVLRRSTCTEVSKLKGKFYELPRQIANPRLVYLNIFHQAFKEAYQDVFFIKELSKDRILVNAQIQIPTTIKGQLASKTEKSELELKKITFTYRDPESFNFLTRKLTRTEGKRAQAKLVMIEKWLDKMTNDKPYMFENLFVLSKNDKSPLHYLADILKTANNDIICIQKVQAILGKMFEKMHFSQLYKNQLYKDVYEPAKIEKTKMLGASESINYYLALEKEEVFDTNRHKTRDVFLQAFEVLTDNKDGLRKSFSMDMLRNMVDDSLKKAKIDFAKWQKSNPSPRIARQMVEVEHGDEELSLNQLEEYVPSFENKEDQNQEGILATDFQSKETSPGKRQVIDGSHLVIADAAKNTNLHKYFMNLKPTCGNCSPDIEFQFENAKRRQETKISEIKDLPNLLMSVDKDGKSCFYYLIEHCKLNPKENAQHFTYYINKALECGVGEDKKERLDKLKALIISDLTKVPHQSGKRNKYIKLIIEELLSEEIDGSLPDKIDESHVNIFLREVAVIPEPKTPATSHSTGVKSNLLR